LKYPFSRDKGVIQGIGFDIRLAAFSFSIFLIISRNEQRGTGTNQNGARVAFQILIIVAYTTWGRLFPAEEQYGQDVR
jgi:hypothetical protein